MAERLDVGTHVVMREEGNLFVYHFRHGPVTAADLEKMGDFERTTKQPGPTHHLVIFENDVSIMPGAVRRATTMVRGLAPQFAAVVVRSYYLRTSLEFMNRTLRLLGSKVEMDFFQDESLARSWMAEKRNSSVTNKQ
jgi:hypothetical protein